MIEPALSYRRQQDVRGERAGDPPIRFRIS